METLFHSAIPVTALRAGVARLPAGWRRAGLQENLEYLEKRMLPLFAGRVLHFDLACTQAYAALLAKARGAGLAVATADGILAAIAAANGFSVATRDISLFDSIDAWENRPVEGMAAFARDRAPATRQRKHTEAVPMAEMDDDEDALLAELAVGDVAPAHDDITALRHLQSRVEQRANEVVADRVPRTGFETFQPVFERVEPELEPGARKALRFGRDDSVAEVGDIYKLHKLNHVKPEAVFHRLFGAAQIDLTIEDRIGHPVTSREWFCVPLHALDEAVQHVRSGSITRAIDSPATARLVDYSSTSSNPKLK